MERLFRGATELSGVTPGISKSYENNQRWYSAVDQLQETLPQEGILPLYEINALLYDSLSMKIDDIVSSDNPIIKVLGILDKRCGKRRLKTMNHLNQPPFVEQLYKYRCIAEGIK